MRPLRSLLLLFAGLFALLLQPAAAASAHLLKAGASASVESCACVCADIPDDCCKDDISCDGAMPSCRAYAGCGMAVAVEPATSTASDRSDAAPPDIWPAFASLHGRSIEPETRPPNPLGQQA